MMDHNGNVQTTAYGFSPDRPAPKNKRHKGALIGAIAAVLVLVIVGVLITTKPWKQ